MINIPKTAIFIPTYQRFQKLPRLIDNIFSNTPAGLFHIYLILEESDINSRAVAKSMGIKFIINKGRPCYADCINSAYRQTKEAYFFCGADDLEFKPNWLEEAMKCMKKGVGVIGTNDLGTIPIGPDRDATHYLVSREYIQKHSGRMDMPDTVLYPYNHNYTDKELVETSRKRGAYVYAPMSVVEHLHWAWNKAQMDETYRKGFDANNEDKQTFESRQHLWK